MCSRGCCSLRCFVTTFLLICFVFTVIRQAFDFLGYQFMPIAVNFLHILALVFVIFGVVQLRPWFLIGFLIWSPIWLAWNCFLVVYFFNVGSLDRGSDLLTFFTNGTNWWIGKTGCDLVYDRTLRQNVPANCLFEFWQVEVFETILQLTTTFVAVGLVVLFLLNFSNHKFLRAATNTTMRVPYQPRVILEPVEDVKRMPSLPTGYQSDTTGYLNASIDSSVKNGVVYAGIARNPRPKSNGSYLPPHDSLERKTLEENGVLATTDVPIPNYRRPKTSSSSNSQKRKSNQGNGYRSSNSTDSPSLPPNNDHSVMPPGARPGYQVVGGPGLIGHHQIQRQSSQESEERAEPVYERRYQRGSSLDNKERRRRKDRRNSVPHHKRKSTRSSESNLRQTARSNTSEYGVISLADCQPGFAPDPHRLSSISAPEWDQGELRRQPMAPGAATSRDSIQSRLTLESTYGAHQRGSARGFKNFPSAGVARIAQVGNGVPVSDIDAVPNSPLRYDPTYDSAHLPRPARSSSPVSNSTIPIDETESNAHFPVTSFVSFDPESNTLIRYHDRNTSTPMSTFGGVRGPAQQLDVSPPRYSGYEQEPSPTIPTRYPPPTPIVQEMVTTNNPGSKRDRKPHSDGHRPSRAPPPVPGGHNNPPPRYRAAMYNMSSGGGQNGGIPRNSSSERFVENSNFDRERTRVPSTQDQPDLEGSSLLV